MLLSIDPRCVCRRIIQLTTIVLFLSFQGAAAASLSLDEVLHTALTQNRDLNAARAQVDAAVGRLRQAGLWPNPRLQLSNETDLPFDNQGEYSRSIGFAQDFPIGGRLSRASVVARVDVARALTEVNVAEASLIANVTTAFDTIVILDQKIALRDELIDIDASLSSATSARYRLGEVSALDVNAASLELARVKLERANLSAERMSTVKTLAGLMGNAPDAPLALNTDLPALVVLSSPAELTDQALQRRPDLRLLSLAADRAGAEQALARASAWEDWNVSLGVRQDRRVILGTPPQPTDKALMLTLSIPIPLFNRNQGTEAAAAADEITAREQLAALRTRIENDVLGGYQQVNGLVDAIRTYREQVLPLSRNSIALVRNSYRSGQVSISDVVLTERQQRELRASYADALEQYFRALEKLNATAMSNAALLTKPVDSSAPTTTEH